MTSSEVFKPRCFISIIISPLSPEPSQRGDDLIFGKSEWAILIRHHPVLPYVHPATNPHFALRTAFAGERLFR